MGASLLALDKSIYYFIVNWLPNKRSNTLFKHGIRRFDFRSCSLAFVCLLIYRAQLSAMETSYKALNIGWDVADVILSHASLISAVFIAFERFYVIYWPLFRGPLGGIFFIVIGVTLLK